VLGPERIPWQVLDFGLNAIEKFESLMRMALVNAAFC